MQLVPLHPGKSLQLDWKPVTRDCVFYSASIVFVLFIMADGKVWWWEGVISVCLYFVYVGFMTQNEKVMSWIDKTISRKVMDEEAGEVGLRVALKDAHWSALYREPMTSDFVSSSSNGGYCLWCRPEGCVSGCVSL